MPSTEPHLISTPGVLPLRVLVPSLAESNGSSDTVTAAEFITSSQPSYLTCTTFVYNATFVVDGETLAAGKAIGYRIVCAAGAAASDPDSPDWVVIRYDTTNAVDLRAKVEVRIYSQGVPAE